MKKTYKSIRMTSVESDVYKKHKKAYQYAMDKTLMELTQSVEGMIHNLNSLQSRSGAQLPFSSINYGTCTLFEGRAIIKALIEGTMQGTGKHHRTAIFPCCIFQYSKKIHGTKEHPGPNYDLFRLALKSTAHRIYPNYANVDWSINLKGNEFDRAQKGEALQRLMNGGKAGHKIYDDVAAWLEKNPDYQDYLSLTVFRNEHDHRVIKVEPAEKFTRYEVMATMGCRTYNGYDINCDADYFVELFKWIAVHGKPADNMMLSANQKDGRGNICPVTIIMPTLAMMAKESGSKDVVSTFMKLLDKKIFEARDMLIERFTLICSQSSKSAPFMWTNNTMVGYIPDEGPVSALKHGTLAIGQLGLAETLQILVGSDQTTKEGLNLGIRIEKLFNQRCAEFKKENKLNFGVYYTPAEGLCYTAMKKFKAKYGELKNISDHEYFTNSMHVPVYDDVDAFTKIDIESQMTGLSNAGCITYVELPSNAINNIDACEELVVYMMDKDIPYAALNFKLNTCRDCGYHGIDVHDECPICGSHNIEHLARVTGYLSVDVSNMNYGKQKETHDRVEHTGVKII